MTTPPPWEPDEAGDAYTLSSGDIRCRIWRTMGTWQALVSQRGDATAAYQFATVEAAQAWCEGIIAERRASRA